MSTAMATPQETVNLLEKTGRRIEFGGHGSPQDGVVRHADEFTVVQPVAPTRFTRPFGHIARTIRWCVGAGTPRVCERKVMAKNRQIFPLGPRQHAATTSGTTSSVAVAGVPVAGATVTPLRCRGRQTVRLLGAAIVRWAVRPATSTGAASREDRRRSA